MSNFHRIKELLERHDITTLSTDKLPLAIQSINNMRDIEIERSGGRLNATILMLNDKHYELVTLLFERTQNTNPKTVKHHHDS